MRGGHLQHMCVPAEGAHEMVQAGKICWQVDRASFSQAKMSVPKVLQAQNAHQKGEGRPRSEVPTGPCAGVCENADQGL